MKLFYNFLILCFIFCFVVPSSGQGFPTMGTGNGGNPMPRFCDEPCDTQLRRWFTFEFGSSEKDMTLYNFDLSNFYFHEGLAEGKPLLIVDWNLVDAQGPFPNGTTGVQGASVGGQFYDFPVTVPAGETLKIYVEIFLIGCVSDNNGFPTRMPEGYYSIDFRLDLGEDGIASFKTVPSESCNPDWISNSIEAVETINVNPNPFSDYVNYSVILTQEGICSLSLYNIHGQEVKKIMQNQLLEAGRNDFSFNVPDIPRGIYFARLETPTGIKNVQLVKE